MQLIVSAEITVLNIADVHVWRHSKGGKSVQLLENSALLEDLPGDLWHKA